MPQLDLLWFLFNFLLAWLLIITFFFCLIKQNWFSTPLNEGEGNSLNTEKQNPQISWNW
uniref:ATP synthase subunit 8 n=1 Tax=Stichopus chloronotus TaxID=240144 RepID=A0A7U1ARI6_STICL|nr:ATP synthase F0 subunit 8 [Stichopus chloronotus]QQY85600.1 ATP synthase subunit 8 [Stichopus chloronotus]USH58724.1 ATP synthase F0 subunit 8 [Stichopus chloronotus]